MKYRKTLRWLSLLVVIVAVAAIFAPWQSWIEQKLIAIIVEKGYGPAGLTLDHIGTDGLILRDLSLGEPPLKLARVTVGYQLRALLKGELNAVRIHGLDVNITMDELGWNIEGLPPPSRVRGDKQKQVIPMRADALKAIPFTQLDIRESMLHLAAKNIVADMKLDVVLQHGATNSLRVDGRDLTIKLPGTTIAIAAIKAHITLDAAVQQWQGNWMLDGITITSESIAAMPLKAAGTITVFTDAVQFTGSVASEDQSYDAQFAGEYSLIEAARSHLKLLQAHVPWGGGEIAAKNVKIPLGGNATIDINLEVKKLAMGTLMQALTGNKATASGVVSGVLPLHITKTGAIRIGKTELKADGPGIIALSPEVIPGDNPHITTVRELLKNLHYTALTLDLAMAADNTLSATLAVEGANPDAKEGRPVKLNVHLSGDLLNFIVSNQQLLGDPKSFIEQKHHE